MGRINVLGFDVANLIAAGEVVDRPASVVKELLENSIDAGATALTVEIQRGGVAFIRVADNGCGIEKDDMPTAILRHATSKIHTKDDLSAINTLGFRGEALAAIASVSRMRIFSKTKESETGCLLTAEAGEIADIVETGCADGTTVVVENLFYNVPARRKFLKKDTTESVAVGAVAEKIALSRPDIALKYICDGRLKFATCGDGDLKNAVLSVYGKECADRSVAVDSFSDGIRVSGYISEPDFWKSNRNMENFFVNGRFVKSKTAAAAVEQAYRAKIPQEKFPFCVIGIEINPIAVDVNVHPTKLEIKFSNEKIIFDAVYYAVLGALESNVSRPELTLRGTGASEQESRTAIRQTAAEFPVRKPETKYEMPARMSQQSGTDFFPAEKEFQKEEREEDSPVFSQGPDRKEIRKLLNAFVPVGNRDAKGVQEKISFNAPAEDTSSQPREEEKPSPQPQAEKPEYIILGEAYNTYVIVQISDRLLFVDKHAAHERIIFDELCKRMKEAEHASQMLMVPLHISLLFSEADALSEYEEKIKKTGFEYTLEETDNHIDALITEIPDMLTQEEAAELFRSLASTLLEVGAGAEKRAQEFFESKLFQASCKAAIKGGRIYDMSHIKWICDRLFVSPDQNGGNIIKTCPHGRPVAFEIKKSSIDRQFERLQ